MSTVTGINFHIFTTNQELDHNSDAVMEVIRGGRVIGSISTGRNHGKTYTDGTHNDLMVHPTETITTNELPSLQYRIRMGAVGNNKWRFKLTLSAIESNGRTIYRPEKGETELNSRGTNSVFL